MEDIKNILKKAKRVVIKIGSKALADKSGRISYSRIKFLASSVKYLRSKNIDCLTRAVSEPKHATASNIVNKLKA